MSERIRPMETLFPEESDEIEEILNSDADFIITPSSLLLMRFLIRRTFFSKYNDTALDEKCQYKKQDNVYEHMSDTRYCTKQI